MQHRVIQGEETFIHGVPSRRWLTKRSSCVLIDRPRVGHSGPRSSRWGNRLRSIGRQWQRKRASFILWRWSSVDSDQSTTLTLINSFIGERLQETLLMHTWDCAFVCFLLVCSGSIFISCWWSLCSCQVVLCLFSCCCLSCYLPTSFCLQPKTENINLCSSKHSKAKTQTPDTDYIWITDECGLWMKRSELIKIQKKEKKRKSFLQTLTVFCIFVRHNSQKHFH